MRTAETDFSPAYAAWQQQLQKGKQAHDPYRVPPLPTADPAPR